MNKQLYVAVAGVLLVLALKCSTEQKMNFEKLEYFNAELEEAPQLLTINSTGLALYESHTNVHHPDHPEIGIYETTLGAGEMSSLRTRLSSPPFRDLPDHWGKVMPSDRYKRIRITTASETIEKLYGTTAPLSSAAADLIDYLDRLASEASRSPRQTLIGELSQLAVNSDRLLTSTLTLSNSGLRPTFCRHPRNMIGVADGFLKVEVWPDKPAGSLHADDVLSFSVEKVLSASQEGEQSDTSILEIPSKSSVTLRLEAQFPEMNAGTYLVRVIYESLIKQLEGQQLVYGELYSRTAKVNAP